MRDVVLVSCFALASTATGVLAQTPAKDDIIRQLTPAKPMTRSIGQARKIEVVPGEPDKTLAEIKDLPSVTIRVLFGLGSDRLTPEGEAALRPLGEALRDPKLSAFRMLIGGHTDAAGSPGHNQALSERRARSVREHLVTAYGIAPSRLASMGFGFRKLADPDRPLDGVNRRVEVVNLTQ